MSKRISDEVRILDFFEGASIERASALFNIVASRMKGRLSPENVTPAPTKKRKRRSKADSKPDSKPVLIDRDDEMEDFRGRQ